MGWLRDKIATVRARAQFERQLMESIVLRDPWNIARDSESDLNWQALGARPWTQERRVTLDQARDRARVLWRENAHARNIVAQMVNYTVGKGFEIKFSDSDVQEEWELTAKMIRWSKRRRQIVRRLIIDGETFVRKWGRVVRFVQPERIGPSSDPDVPNTVDGVVTAPDDIETPTGYVIDEELVPAMLVKHFKPSDCDLDETRGWPALYDAEPIVRNYENWIKDRALLNSGERMKAA